MVGGTFSSENTVFIKMFHEHWLGNKTAITFLPPQASGSSASGCSQHQGVDSFAQFGTKYT